MVVFNFFSVNKSRFNQLGNTKKDVFQDKNGFLINENGPRANLFSIYVPFNKMLMPYNKNLKVHISKDT